jgi:hypothetical protein
VREGERERGANLKQCCLAVFQSAALEVCPCQVEQDLGVMKIVELSQAVFVLEKERCVEREGER